MKLSKLIFFPFFSPFKLAQFRQKKAQSDGQTPSKKQKRKKKSSARKYEDSSYTSNIDQSQGDQLYMNSSQRGASMTPEFSIMRTLQSGEIIKHDQSYTIEPESEISTTADDYSSEVRLSSFGEEEFGVDESYSEQGAQYSSTRLEMMENELAGKQQEIEELSRELEEMRAAFGTEGLQQLQEFEAAIKQRDGIITQLTANLQQARKEKDETMREFLELTEQSQKLQIQFQHLQASETLRNSSHSNTAADLLQAKQQILTHQQQLEEQDHLLEDYQKKKEEFKKQINLMQEKIRTYEMREQNKNEDSSKKELQEKESVIEELKTKIIEEERNLLELKDKISATDKLLEEFKEQIIEKNQEINNIRLELTNSKQKERQCSDEIKQLMGTVEELQKKNHKESQFESDMIQRMEQETQRKLEQLRAELDEMYGQQIVQMKQELIKQHVLQIDELNAQHKGELENTLKSCPNITVNEDQIQLMNMAINELNLKLQDANSQKEKIKEQLEVISGEKSILQRQLEDLFEELSFSRDQIQRARQTIVEQEGKLNEAHRLLSSVEDLKAQIVSASEFRKELELKHEAEVTNYKIKLEMLEKEKNAVLDRMAESQEAELERLRTQLLFSHEEELSKLREDLEIEHQINIEKFKDKLGIHYKQQIEELHSEMSQKIETMQFEKDNLITKQNQLLLEISKLKDLQQSLVNSQSEEMTLQISELQKEIEVLRQEEKEKGTLEQEVQELQLKTEFLEKQIKEKEDDLQEKFTQLEAENNILKNEKKALEDMLKIYVPISKEESLIIIDSAKSKSEDYDWQKKMDILLEENEKLTKQCDQLNEEIEKQRNTYSFAEKNFEVNYQELREEYACLLKVKADLEDSKSKQEAEYQMQVQALTDELCNLQRIKPILVKSKSSDSESCKDDKPFTTEISEVVEVVEKDTTELMEKLEVTQREKLELSERLSDLSEQLKQKHGEIDHLSEEVKSLKQEKEQVLKKCKELEIIIGHSRAEHMDELKLKLCDFKDGIQTEESKDSERFVFKKNKDFSEGAKITEENEISSEDAAVKKECKQGLVKQEKHTLLDHLDSVTDQLANESTSSSLAIAQSENYQLQQELRILKSEQADLRLQMEAQRFCLSLVHSAHVKQVQACMEEETASALNSLREDLVSAHEEEMKELQKMHHLELQNRKGQKIGKSWTLFFSPWSNLIIDKCILKLCFLHDLDLQSNMQSLVNKIAEEYNKLLVLQSQLTINCEKVIVSMSIAYAQQSEIARISRQKEDVASVTQINAHQQKELFLSDRKCSRNEISIQTFDQEEMKFKELKPLSKELREEEFKEILLSNSSNLESTFELKDQELDFSREVFSSNREFIFTEHVSICIFKKKSLASRQLMMSEEQLEDLRQELVRQYQEHQQATELLKQAHMHQMERQREDHEQLQEEIRRLHQELAQVSASIDNENLVTERERVLLEELEALKQRSLAGREKLCCELRSSYTQTQDENESQGEIEEPIIQEELEEKPPAVSSDILSKERYALQKANNRLLKILLEVVKTIAAVEETIGRHVLGILDRSNKGQSSTNIIWKSESEGTVKSCIHEEDTEEESMGSYCGSGMPSHATSTWSEITDEGMELCQRLLRCSLAGTEIDPENEELVLNVSSRLQAAVEKLLEAISETSSQLEHAKVTQTELMRESFRQKQEATEFLKCQEELLERLFVELKASRTIGIIDGYADEKALFERQIQEKTDIIDHLQQELLCVGNRLQELEAERQQIQEERELLSRQKDAMKAEAGPVEQQLLQETEKLMKEKLEVQCQAEKVCDDLQKQVKTLEMDVEEQVSRFMELEQEKNAELMDLRQQNQALEKQLEKMRKFLDEQAIDREHERDVFQQEILKLEQQLKATPKFQPISEHQTREVEQLTNHLKEKTDKCSELLLSKEQLQRDVQERNEEIEKLESRIRELEQALLISADNLQKVENRKHFGAVEAKELPLEVQLQAEREALDRKEKEITNLEEQLEQFREELENKNEEVQQLHMQLEIQKKEATTRLEELEQENRLFKNEMERLGFAVQEFEDVSTKDHHQLFGKFTQMIEEKELEIGRLNGQITRLQQQLEITTDNKIIEEKNQLIQYLESQLEFLKSDQERIKKNSEEEIEQLSDVIEKLQQELSSIEQKAPEDFSSLPEEPNDLKQQLEAVRADKLALEQEVGRTREEAALAHAGLRESSARMNHLQEELDALREEQHGWSQTQSPRGSVQGAGQSQPKQLGIEDPTSLQPPAGKSRGFGGELELALLHPGEKGAEPRWMEDSKGQADKETLQREVSGLRAALEEKVAAFVVSQAQLRAIQEHVSRWQQRAVSELSGGAQEAQGDSRPLCQKEPKEAAEERKEKKLLGLEETPEEVEKKEKKEEDAGLAQVSSDSLIFFPKHSALTLGLWTLSGCLRAEKDPRGEANMALQEELNQIKHQLMEAEKKLEYYLKKEGELRVSESQKASCELGQFLAERDSPLTGQNSSSQMDRILQVSSGHQTPHIVTKHTGIQSDPPSSCPSEDVTEVRRQLTEKMAHMQELHAAEILDMEARHIHETDSLKREQAVAVRLLTEECGALKAAIHCLRAREGVSVPGSTHSDSYQSREMCSSDSGSDWSQGVYLTQSQGFDSASDGPGEEGESSTDSFPKRIKGLLRAVHNEGIQVLSLTEPPYSEGDANFAHQASEFWLEERKTYLNAISSLKDLITKMQVQRETELYESSQPQENPPDWRGEFLCALQQVFLMERNILLAMFKTDVTALGTRDVLGLLNQVEQRLQEQGLEYRAAIEYIQSADRRSLLTEIQTLQAQVKSKIMTLKREQESDLQNQELLEYNMQQKQAQILEMQVELSTLKERAAELQDQLNAERVRAAELQDGWTQAKLELETTLKAQHKHLKELEAFRMEVKEKTDKVHLLNDTLANEQKKTRELQWALEKEKAKLERNEEREREELEDLKYSLEGQKQRNVQLNQLLEQQKQLLTDLQQKIVAQGALYDAQISEERSQKSELQGLLESEKVRVLEIQETLERERELHAQLQAHDDHEQDKASTSSEDVLKELQKQLYEKHNRIVELVSAIEKYKLDFLQMRQQTEKDRQMHRKTLLTEQQANTEGLKKIHELQSKLEDLQWQLEEKRQQIYKLELERKRSQEIIQELQKQEQEKEEKIETERVSYQNLNEPTTWDSSSDRTRNWVLQQKIEGAEEKESSYPPLIEMNGDGTIEDIREPEAIRQKLQIISSKLQQLVHKASSRLQFEAADNEDLIWVQKNIDHILLQLQKFTGLSQQGEATLVSPGLSCNSLTERLLRQNAELTGHIRQLTEEKNDLRNVVMKLEEEIRWFRKTGPCGDYSNRHSFSRGTNIEAVIASEKEIWNREKLALQKSLRQAEAEVCRLKAELRNEALLQDLNPNSESTALKRIYGKYLRAESFRKALIYQKNYLLLLLGGFQECEDATLALIARMGGQPSCTDLTVITSQSKGFTRFRSAVRVSIAISRMKFLVRRWHRVTGSCSININRDGFGQNPGTDKTDPFYHSPGGLELCGEQRHSSYRSRSDLDCPRSPLHFQHRYPGTPADLNPGSLACSQLQNYDPDRALTDYIHRLEALQRRLGNVQSGRFHAGMRR
uniref:A-kinase anchoring protein 9 n=1 Tax=Monodelphis domestica TaxID=13616 RepID=A0A5F8G920_MONDO